MAKGKQRIKEQQLSQKIEQEIETKDDAYNQGVFKYLRLLVHLIAALQFCYGVYYHYFKVHWPGEDIKRTPAQLAEWQRSHWGDKFKFLTFLNAILQAIYHIVALLNDFFGSNEVSPSPMPALRKLKDYLFAAFAFPLAANVCISFWVIYAYDRELVFPAELDAIFPNWLNHIVHTNIAMLIILDMFTCFRQYPSRKQGLAGTIVFMILYIIWIHIVKHYSGQWVYPLLEVLNMPMRYVMIGGLLGLTVLLYFVGELFNSIVWDQELKLLKRKQL